MKKHIENLKGKSMSNCIDPVNNSKVIAPEMFKLNLQPLSYNLKKNRKAHVDYSKITKEHADILREIVDQARALQPLDNALEYASKSKSINKNEWKPTGKVFTNVGYKWLTTERTFAIVGNKCPLTRITSTKIVPHRKSIQTNVIIDIPPLKVYTRIPKETTTVCSSSEPRIIEYRPSNNSKPNKTWGYNVSKFPSSSRVQRRSYRSSSGTVRFGNDHFAAIMGYGYYHIRNVTISRVYYVEGLGHKLFSVGSKDETPEFGIKFLKKVQVSLNATVRFIRTDNETEFVNHTLKSYYEDVGITHQTSVTRTP
ncbi:retrovirus-related pol polyprotein from transposon TNT 1-94 [Tanacetum coccineum]